MMSPAISGTQAKETTRGLAGSNAYSDMLSYLSLRWPALWRIRIDLLLIYLMATVVLFIGRLGVFAFGVDTDWILGGQIWEVVRAVSMVGALVFGFLWVFLILRYERLRTESGFRNRPSFTIMFLWVNFFLLGSASFHLLCFLTDMRPDDHPLRIDRDTMNLFFLVCVRVAIGTGTVALIVKVILLSSVMRMLGSVALALGICAGVAAVWLTCLLSKLMYEAYFPEIHGRVYGPGPWSLPHQIGTITLVTFSIWTVSRLIFRGRMLGRNVLCALIVLLSTALCEAAIVLGVYEVTDFLPDAVRNGYDFPVWLILVTVSVGYLIPHFVAIGGDLLRGSRSRLTSPVILSCFWSVPACILGGFYLAANTSYSVLGIPISDMQIVVAGFAAVLCITAIELLSWLAVRISFLPEP